MRAEITRNGWFVLPGGAIAPVTCTQHDDNFWHMKSSEELGYCEYGIVGEDLFWDEDQAIDAVYQMLQERLLLAQAAIAHFQTKYRDRLFNGRVWVEDSPKRLVIELGK